MMALKFAARKLPLLDTGTGAPFHPLCFRKGGSKFRAVAKVVQ
jgi:hypothetical protein